MRDTPLLDRDNPAHEPLGGHTKVTRNDWLNIARDVLVNDGAAEVKILKLADLLSVSRSSFYWYFQNRQDLLDALLDEWSTRNTAQIIAHCQMPAANITEGCCNFFRCFVNPEIFDSGLDFAVREWTRRDPVLRDRVDTADEARIAAVITMFEKFAYPAPEADARARILYFMQLGYHALKVSEPMELRISRVDAYIAGFTGRPTDQTALAEFITYIRTNNLT